MTIETKKTGKKKRFFKNVTGFKRFLLFFGIYLFLFVIGLWGAAEYTSRPSFCPSCHYMETFHQSWRNSSHNKVDCVDCHFEPGVSGTIKGKMNGLVQIVNYVSLSYKKRKPWAEISDNTCITCHNESEIRDTELEFKGVSFSHKQHLGELTGDIKLKCTSCHSQEIQGTHFEVSESTCFTCHFKNSDKPELTFAGHNNKQADCNTCHNLDKKSKDQLSVLRYDHNMIVEKGIDCKSCHTNTVNGSGDVGKERCQQCHFETEKLQQFGNTKAIHNTHIVNNSIKCFSCHTPIQHKIQQIDPNSPPDCMSCHSNAHAPMVSLFTGQNGGNVEKTPSAMFLSGINCKGCHVIHETSLKDIGTMKAGESACESCHGPGFGKLMNTWKQSTEKRLGTIKSIYRTASGTVNNSKNQRKSEAEALLKDASHNIRIVEVGKSVHNIQFSDKLLVAAYNQMKEALKVIGSPLTLPAFQSGTDLVPNECSSCHMGIQEINVAKFGMNFSHNLHMVKNRISCDRCHSNARTHGELILTKQSCNSCHHAKVENDDQCSKCHSLQVQMYTGSYMNKSHPDFMKVGEVRCVDCHLEGKSMVKPDVSNCAKCHDNSYSEMALEWKDDVKKLTADLQNIIAEVRKMNLNSEQKALVNDAGKLAKDIASHPSIYAHNYDLISTLLSDRIKELKKLKE